MTLQASLIWLIAAATATAAARTDLPPNAAAASALPAEAAAVTQAHPTAGAPPFWGPTDLSELQSNGGGWSTVCQQHRPYYEQLGLRSLLQKQSDGLSITRALPRSTQQQPKPAHTPPPPLRWPLAQGQLVLFLATFVIMFFAAGAGVGEEWGLNRAFLQVVAPISSHGLLIKRQRFASPPLSFAGGGGILTPIMTLPQVVGLMTVEVSAGAGSAAGSWLWRYCLHLVDCLPTSQSHTPSLPHALSPALSSSSSSSSLPLPNRHPAPPPQGHPPERSGDGRRLSCQRGLQPVAPPPPEGGARRGLRPQRAVWDADHRRLCGGDAPEQGARCAVS